MLQRFSRRALILALVVPVLLAFINVEAHAQANASLYKYWNQYSGTIYYTTTYYGNPGGAGGWFILDVEGGVTTYEVPGVTVPLYEYYNSQFNRYFYTTCWCELGGGSSIYTYTGITAYVFDQPAAGRWAIDRWWTVYQGWGLHTYLRQGWPINPNWEYNGVAFFVQAY